MNFPHNIRRAFCPCAKCTALRLMIHEENARRVTFNFNARPLGTYLEMAKRYQNGELD